MDHSLAGQRCAYLTLDEGFALWALMVTAMDQTIYQRPATDPPLAQVAWEMRDFLDAREAAGLNSALHVTGDAAVRHAKEVAAKNGIRGLDDGGHAKWELEAGDQDTRSIPLEENLLDGVRRLLDVTAGKQQAPGSDTESAYESACWLVGRLLTTRCSYEDSLGEFAEQALAREAHLPEGGALGALAKMGLTTQVSWDERLAPRPDLAKSEPDPTSREDPVLQAQPHSQPGNWWRKPPRSRNGRTSPATEPASRNTPARPGRR